MATRVGLRISKDCFRLVCGLLGVGLLSGVLGLAGCSSSSQSGPPSAPQPQVTVSSGGQVRIGSTAQFTATVTGEANTAVTWQVNGTTGGSAAVGTISTGGLYTPPTSIPATNPVVITAVSVAAPTVTGTANETVWNPLPAVTSAQVSQNYGAATGLATVMGTGFVPTSVVQAAGVNQSTTFVSSTQLQATVPVAAGATTVAWMW